jgi:undecaprenyl-diphosphatase
MSEYFNAVILGIIEGITEFLPISSTGHLIIAERFFQLHNEEFSKMFDVVIQFGAILSVIIYFRDKLIPPLKTDTEEKAEKFKAVTTLWAKSLVGVIPAIVIGAALGKKIKEHLFNPWVVAAALFTGGIILVIIEAKERKHKFEDVSGLSFMSAFWIGLIQCVAMVPGVSRAAATIIGGMFLGASRKAAAEYSFYLAIPTMAAASAYSLLKHRTPLSKEEWIVLGVGFWVSFFTAWGVIAFLMNFIRTRTFTVFGYYRIFLAVIVADYFFFFK